MPIRCRLFTMQFDHGNMFMSLSKTKRKRKKREETRSRCETQTKTFYEGQSRREVTDIGTASWSQLLGSNGQGSGSSRRAEVY